MKKGRVLAIFYGGFMIIRRAKSGESIREIAAEYCISPSYLMGASGVCGRTLAEGREVIIPLPSRSVSAKSGDTVDGIAHRFGVKREEIYALNPDIWLSGRVYPSEYVVLRLAEPKIGVAAVNGQIYSGITREKVKRALPYLNTLTVSAARASGEKIKIDSSLLRYSDMARENGICPILRIYIEEMPVGAWDNFIRGAILMAKSRGFSGVALGGLSHLEKGAVEFTVRVRGEMIKEGLSLSVEGAIDAPCPYTEYADTAVMTLDKLQLCPIPDFDDFERKQLESLSEGADVSNMLLELSSFALSDGEFFGRDEAFSALDLRGAELFQDDKKRITHLKRGRKTAVFESIENTYERIKIATECGYLGFSVDIARVPFCELFMLSAITGKPINMGDGKSILNCRAERTE